MFKFAMAIAVLAISVSLATGVPQPAQEPNAAATNSVIQKRQKPVVYAAAEVSESDGGGGGSGGGDADTGAVSGLSGLLEVIGAPKKMLGFVGKYIVGQIKSMTLKRLLKIALVGALVTVLGAVAAVAVAGLVSLVSGLCAALPYVQMFLGLGGGGNAQISNENMDMVTEFVMGAMNKYEKLHKA